MRSMVPQSDVSHGHDLRLKCGHGWAGAPLLVGESTAMTATH